MAFKFNPFTGQLDHDTAGSAASSATAAANSATAAAASASAAATSETNAKASEDAAELASDHAAGLFTKANSTAYNINTNTDFGSIVYAGAAFSNEASITMLSMSLGSSTFDYLSV